MRAAVHKDVFELEIVEREIPRVVNDDDVLLKVGAVGFCGSDKHDLDHPPERPQIPGHEFAGVIAGLGGMPSEFSVGDRVAVRPNARCGRCAGCLQWPREPCASPGVYGCRGIQHPPGAMAEYVLVRTENLTKIPDDISLEEAAMADPLAVALYAIDLGPPVKGETCIVMGAGVIGLLLGQVLKLRKAGHIVLVDVIPSHLELASRCGGFECLLADDRESLSACLEPLLSGIYYELAGGESPTLDIAIQCIRREGTILLVSQRPKGVWLNYQWVMGKGLTLRGVSGYRDKHWLEALNLIFTRSVDVVALITHRYPLEFATEALLTAVYGDSLKVILKPNKDLE